MDANAMDFSQDFDNCDIKIIVEEDTLYAHKMILSMASPVFKAVLNSNFKEGESNIVKLPGKTKGGVIEFLSQIYPNYKPIDKNNDVYSLLDLAREYQVDNLQNRIDDYLSINQDVPETLDKKVNLLLKAQDYGLEKFSKTLSLLLEKESYEDLKKHPKYNEILAVNLGTILKYQIEKLKEKHEIEKEENKKAHVEKRNEIRKELDAKCKSLRIQIEKYQQALRSICNEANQTIRLSHSEDYKIYLPERHCTCKKDEKYNKKKHECEECAYNLQQYILAKRKEFNRAASSISDGCNDALGCLNDCTNLRL